LRLAKYFSAFMLIAAGYQTAWADVLMASRDTAAVLHYDDKTGAYLGVFATTSAMTNPEAVTLGPDGNLYVADRDANAIFRFNGKTGAFIDTFVSAANGRLSGPRDLLFGPDGNLYVSGNESNQVLVFDGTTGAFLRVFSGGTIPLPRGLAFQGGDVYIACESPSQILHYKLSGALVGVFASGGQIQSPREMVFGPDGNLYVSSSANNVVLRFNGSTGAAMGVFASGGGLMFPRGLTFGLDGNLYVVSANSNAILRYNGLTGAFINTFASGGGPSFPTGLLFTSTSRTVSHIANGAGWRTSVILIDTGTQVENFELKFWDNNGNPLPLDLGADGITADLTGTLQPGVTRFIRTAGTGAALQTGWAELIVPQTIDGNSIFGLQSPGQGDSEAAVPLSPSGGTQLFLPFAYTTGYSTGVAFTDPEPLAATVSASILDDSNAAIASANTFPVPARGHFSDVLADQALYPAVVGKRGVVHFTSNASIFGLGIRANGKAFTSIDALAGVTSATKTIPHIANGGSWKTTFLIVSTSAQSANFTLNFWSDGGAALSLPLGTDGTASSLSGTVQPGELRVVQTTGAGTLVTGWAELTGLTGAIGGTAIFALQAPGQSDSEAAVPFSTASSMHLFMPYDYSPGYSTGIAFTNTGASQATVTATFTDDGGHALGSGQIMVPAHGHASAVLGDVLAAIVGTRGTVSLASDMPIFGLGIRANGAAFTSLKVIVK